MFKNFPKTDTNVALCMTGCSVTSQEATYCTCHTGCSEHCVDNVAASGVRRPNKEDLVNFFRATTEV